MMKKYFLLHALLFSMSVYGAAQDQTQALIRTSNAIVLGDMEAFERNVSCETVDVPIIGQKAPPTLLLNAIQSEHEHSTTMVARLLELGANPNLSLFSSLKLIVITEHGPVTKPLRAQLPLQFAITLGRIEAVRKLLEHHANPLFTNTDKPMLPYARSLLEKIRTGEATRDGLTEEKMLAIIKMLEEHKQMSD